MKKILGGVALVFATALLQGVFAAESAAVLGIQAQHSALLDMTRFGDKLVAVGERGLVMQSTDEGKTWTGFLAPTDRTLNSVLYVGNKIGIAVGHGGTLIRSEDDGASWVRIKIDAIGTDSILGLAALSDGRMLAYGAFGMYLESTDKGKTWTRRKIIRDDFERHISKVTEIAPGKLLLVGETGTLALSNDMGATWKELESPYAATGTDGVKGSLFGALKLNDGSVMIYGMRGHAYRSTDGAATWTLIPVAATDTFSGASVAADGKIVLAGNNGMIATSADNGQSLALQYVKDGRPLGQAIYAKDGAVIYVGYMSTGRIESSAQKH
jgi:photosystem II stability/assembly factor-like uncharacterized protein